MPNMQRYKLIKQCSLADEMSLQTEGNRTSQLIQTQQRSIPSSTHRVVSIPRLARIPIKSIMPYTYKSISLTNYIKETLFTSKNKNHLTRDRDTQAALRPYWTSNPKSISIREVTGDNIDFSTVYLRFLMPISLKPSN